MEEARAEAERDATGEAGGKGRGRARCDREAETARDDAGEQERQRELDSMPHVDITDYCREYLEPAFA
eukprot:13269234-Alexandrium_andersonii.AAC.1